MDVAVTPLFVGGISANVYTHPSHTHSPLPVHALFMLHGRGQSMKFVGRIVRDILDHAYGPNGANKKRDLIVIAFDHRNHGQRLVDAHRNQGWHADPSKTNDQHAVDMYTIQTGSAQDVSFLVDHIPSYLYPTGEKTIIGWGISGVSLGGHSAWVVLAHEPRIQFGIPIIGCPDFTKLMAHRAQSCDVPFAPPYYPEHLRSHVNKHDPASFPFAAQDPSNPFLGKRILVLSGAKDALVPWSASKEFVEGLQVGDGVKRVVVEDDVGHDCTPLMIKEAALFIEDWLVHE